MSNTKAKLDEIRQMMNSPKTIEGFGLSNEENTQTSHINNKAQSLEIVAFCR